MLIPMFNPRIVLVAHEGCGVNQSDLDAIAAALQIQVDRDFKPAYNLGATVVSASQVDKMLTTDWVVGMFKDVDQPNALGYHDMTGGGMPLAKVFPLLDSKDLSKTISHEVLEMLADPLLSKAVQSHLDGRFWAYEVCDAVEADEYTINGVVVSNFVTPHYFEPPPDMAGIQFDFCNKVSAPYEVRPGGYMQWNVGGGWNQVFHSQQLPRAYRQQVQSRSARRAARFGATK